MKLGTETGSLMNHVMAGGASPEPQVGDGATMLGWTDRLAGTIVKVTRCQIDVQRDNAIRTDPNGASDAQSYRYERNPEGAVTVFRKTKSGWRSRCGYGLLIGQRREYFDFCF